MVRAKTHPSLGGMRKPTASEEGKNGFAVCKKTLGELRSPLVEVLALGGLALCGSLLWHVRIA